jgi:hypothetical protein
VSSATAGDAVLAAWKADGFDGFQTCVAPEARAHAAPAESEAAP